MHTLIQIHQKITRKQITLEMDSYTCADLLTMWWKIDSFLEKLMMSVVELWLLIDIFVCFSYLMSKNIKQRVVLLIQKKEIYGIIWLPQKIVTENTKKAQILNLWEKNDRRHFNLKNIKNKNIIVFQYAMVHYVHFYKQ